MGSAQIKLLNQKVEAIHDLIDAGDEKLDNGDPNSAENKYTEARTRLTEVKPEIQKLRDPGYLNQLMEIEETLDDRRVAVAEMRGQPIPLDVSMPDRKGVSFVGVVDSDEESGDDSGSSVGSVRQNSLLDIGRGGDQAISPDERNEPSATATPLGIPGDDAFSETESSELTPSTSDDDFETISVGRRRSTQVHEEGSTRYGLAPSKAASEQNTWWGGLSEYVDLSSDSFNDMAPSLGHGGSKSYKGSKQSKSKDNSKGTSKGKSKGTSKSTSESSSTSMSKSISKSTSKSMSKGTSKREDRLTNAQSLASDDNYQRGAGDSSFEDLTTLPTRGSSKHDMSSQDSENDTSDTRLRYATASDKKEAIPYADRDDTSDTRLRYATASGKKEAIPFADRDKTFDTRSRYAAASTKKGAIPYADRDDTSDTRSRYATASGKEETIPYADRDDISDTRSRYAVAPRKKEAIPYVDRDDTSAIRSRYATASDKKEAIPYADRDDTSDTRSRYAIAPGKKEAIPYVDRDKTSNVRSRYATASDKKEAIPYADRENTSDTRSRYATASGKKEPILHPGESAYMTMPRAEQGPRYSPKSDLPAAVPNSFLIAPNVAQSMVASFGDPVRTPGNRLRVPSEKCSAQTRRVSSGNERGQDRYAKDQHTIGLNVSQPRRPMFTEDGQLLPSSDDAESIDLPLTQESPRIPVKIGERARRSSSHVRNRAETTSDLNSAFPYLPYGGAYKQKAKTSGPQPVDDRARRRKPLGCGGDDGARYGTRSNGLENETQGPSWTGLYQRADESFLPAQLPARAASCLPKDSGDQKEEHLQFLKDPMAHVYSKNDAFHAWITGEPLPQQGYVEVDRRSEKKSPPRRLGADDAFKFEAHTPRGPQPVPRRYRTPCLAQPADKDQVLVFSEKPVAITPRNVPEPRTHFGPSPEKWPEESHTLVQPEPGRIWPAAEPPPSEHVQRQKAKASEKREALGNSPRLLRQTFPDSGNVHPRSSFSLGHDAVAGSSHRSVYPHIASSPGSDASVSDATSYLEQAGCNGAPRPPPPLPDSSEVHYLPSSYPKHVTDDRALRPPPPQPDSAETHYSSSYPERVTDDRAPGPPPPLPDSAETPYHPSWYPEHVAADRAPRPPPPLPDSPKVSSHPSLCPEQVASDRAPRPPPPLPDSAENPYHSSSYPEYVASDMDPCPPPPLPDGAETQYYPSSYPHHVADDQAARLGSPLFSEPDFSHVQPSTFGKKHYGSAELEQNRPVTYISEECDGAAQIHRPSETYVVPDYDLASSPQPGFQPEGPSLAPSQEEHRYFSSDAPTSSLLPERSVAPRTVHSTDRYQTAHDEDMPGRPTDSMDPRNVLRRGPASNFVQRSTGENVAYNSVQEDTRPLPRAVQYSDHDRYAASLLIRRDGQIGNLIPVEDPQPAPSPRETEGINNQVVRTDLSSPHASPHKRVSFHESVFPSGELGISSRSDNAMLATSMGGGGGDFAARNERRKRLGVSSACSYASYDLLRPRNEDDMVIENIAGGRPTAILTSPAQVSSEAMHSATQHDAPSGHGAPPSTLLSPRSTILREHIDQTKVDQASKKANPSDVYLPHPPAPAPLDDPVQRPVDWHASVQGLTANELALARSLSNPPVSWGDVFGYATVKHQLREHFVYRKRLHPLSERSKGVLLFGPPGCGKTLMAQALAAEIGPSCFAISVAKFTTVNEAADVLRTLFALARKILPSVIFIDDIGDVFGTRTRWDQRDAETIRTVFTAGVESTANDDVRVLCSTNAPFNLISSFTRMMAYKIYVPVPDKHVRRCLLEFYSRSWACLVEGVALDVTARLTAGYSSRDAISVVMRAISLADERYEDGRVCYLGTQHLSEAMSMSPATISPEEILVFEDWAKRFAGTAYGKHPQVPPKVTSNPLFPNFAYRSHHRVTASSTLRDGRAQVVQ